jgi:general secretion pathway protein G
MITSTSPIRVACSPLETRRSTASKKNFPAFALAVSSVQLPARNPSRRWRFVEITDRRAFTLIEIMVVIVILGILAMYVAPKLMGRPEEAKQVRAKMDIAALETALKLYKLDSGVYPGTEQGLQALVQRPEAGVIPKKWRQGGYLEKGKVPKDPWGNDYVYLSPGLKGDFDIICYGADGVPGGENENKDINNWDTE